MCGKSFVLYVLKLAEVPADYVDAYTMLTSPGRNMYGRRYVDIETARDNCRDMQRPTTPGAASVTSMAVGGGVARERAMRERCGCDNLLSWE